MRKQLDEVEVAVEGNNNAWDKGRAKSHSDTGPTCTSGETLGLGKERASTTPTADDEEEEEIDQAMATLAMPNR
jgi:hypothetical protein